jgi:hypothetical protein
LARHNNLSSTEDFMSSQDTPDNVTLFLQVLARLLDNAAVEPRSNPLPAPSGQMQIDVGTYQIDQWNGKDWSFVGFVWVTPPDAVGTQIEHYAFTSAYARPNAKSNTDAAHFAGLRFYAAQDQASSLPDFERILGRNGQDFKSRIAATCVVGS